MAGFRARIVRDERGFTLTEMLVTTTIMMFVLIAFSGLFDMSLKIFSFGNNKVEAVESARIGMEKMERELRAAYPVDAGSDATYLFFNNAAGPTSNPPQAMPTGDNQITFGNERGLEGAGNGEIDCLSAATCEYITYRLTTSAGATPCNAAPCTLRRVNAVNSADPTVLGDPVVENVAANGLSFTYLTSSGGTPAGEGDIGMVKAELTVRVKQGLGSAGTQTLTTVIDLRNRQ